MAGRYVKELKANQHTKSGLALTLADIRRRRDALAEYRENIPVRYHHHYDEVLADASAKLEAANTQPRESAEALLQRVVVETLRQENAEIKQQLTELTSQLPKKREPAAKGTVPCPHVITRGRAEGTTCGSFSCTHRARLEAQQLKDSEKELEESEEPSERWVEVMQSGYSRFLTPGGAPVWLMAASESMLFDCGRQEDFSFGELTEELPSDLEKVVARLLSTSTTKPSLGLVQQEVAAIQEALEREQEERLEALQELRRHKSDGGKLIKDERGARASRARKIHTHTQKLFSARRRPLRTSDGGT